VDSILPFFGCNLLIKAIKVFQFGYVTSHTLSDFAYGFMQLGLSPSR
jgi:hypothetical protein